MRGILSNRFVDALAKTMLFIGVFHFGIRTYLAVRDGIHVLNAFAILNLDVFVPGLGNGLVNLILSYIPILVLYGLVYFSLTNPAKDGKDWQARL